MQLPASLLTRQSLIAYWKGSCNQPESTQLCLAWWHSHPLSTLGSEGNFFSHCGKIRVLFYKVTKTAFQPYCVSSNLLCLSDQVSLWSLYLPQLTLRLLVLRKHDPFTDILLVLISQWPFLFFLLSIFKLFLSSRKRMMVMAKVIFGKWNCWVIFIDIF